jgi:hypothetical protein
LISLSVPFEIALRQFQQAGHGETLVGQYESRGNR